MDTSEQYINMCRQAKELQEMWKPADGDFFHYDDLVNSIGDFVEVNNEIRPMSDWEMYKVKCKDCVWLPRIDQWLQILSDKNIIFGLSNYAQGDSVEITCIKLLYLNIYNKSWNGEDWTCTSNTTA
jgi:hypothetical protein